MIVKVSSRKKGSFKQLINYMLDCPNIGFILTHNIRGDDPLGWVKQFEENETLRKRKRKNSTVLTHEIISWHEKDAIHLSEDVMRGLTRKYLESRGLEGMYVAIAHLDKAHPHVHICASGVGYKSGEVMRMTKARFAKVKKELIRYQKERYPALTHSLPKHGLGIGESDGTYWARKRGNLNNNKLIDLIRQAKQKAVDENGAKEFLQSNGIEIYYRRNKPVGLLFQGRKYRFGTLGISHELLKTR